MYPIIVNLAEPIVKNIVATKMTTKKVSQRRIVKDKNFCSKKCRHSQILTEKSAKYCLKKNCQFKELKFPAKINLGYPEILKRKSVLARHIFH